MGLYGRAARGAEAGVVAAAAVELSFFLLDLIRLEPLATAFNLSGAALAPGGFVIDLSSISGIVAAGWAGYQVLLLTFVHFLIFGVVGALASVLFDWSKPVGVKRVLVVAALCTAAFYAAVAISGSVLAMDAVGVPLVVAMNVLAALVMAGSLCVVCGSYEEEVAEAP